MSRPVYFAVPETEAAAADLAAALEYVMVLPVFTCRRLCEEWLASITDESIRIGTCSVDDWAHGAGIHEADLAIVNPVPGIESAEELIYEAVQTISGLPETFHPKTIVTPQGVIGVTEIEPTRGPR